MNDPPSREDRILVAHAVLVGGGLLAFLVVRYLVGIEYLVVLVFYATPLAIPVLVLVLGLAVVGSILLLLTSFRSLVAARRAPVGLVLTLATWLVLALLADLLVRGPDGSVAGPRASEAVLWAWGVLGLVVVRWRLGARRAGSHAVGSRSGARS